MKDLKEHLEKIITVNLEVPENDLASERFLIVFDKNCPLAKILSESYMEILPEARLIDYYTQKPDEIIAQVKQSKPGDLVILVQSTSFRMSNFRWRLELFNLKLSVIEHAHLSVNKPEEFDTYLDTLRFDQEYYQRVSAGLMGRLAQAKEVRLIGASGELVYEGPFEEAKKNIGDFNGFKNKGSGFPIGEVFTEAGNLENVSGMLEIFAFADINHTVIFPERNFRLKVNKGQLTLSEDRFELEKSASGKSLLEILDLVATENPDGIIWLRELGLGMNRGISKTKKLTDISAYERVCGPHISLGLKHDIYREKVPKEKIQRYHVDIFPAVSEIWIDKEKVFENGKYSI